MGRTLKLLTFADIKELNRQMIDSSGGSFSAEDSNLHNSSTLLYSLDAIAGPMFGHDHYPSIFQKAAFLCCRIIQGHVFHDGNKRTGMMVCQALLEYNDYIMRIDMEVVNMALRVANNEVDEPEVATWLEERTVPADQNDP